MPSCPEAVLILTAIAIAGLLVLAGCGGKTIVVMSPAPQATVTMTATPTPDEAAQTTYEAAQTSTLSYDEQRSFDFIDAKFPLVREINSDLMYELDQDSTTTDEGIIAVTHAAERLIPIKRAWGRLDWGYGAVNDLEDDFNVYVNATTRYARAWASGLTGGNVNQAAWDAVNSRERIERFGPRVEQGIDDLRQESQGY